jgi:hypothetical protein
LISWDVRLFWILSFAKDVLLQKIDCVFVLAIRGLLHMIKNFVSRGVILRFNHSYGIFFFWKVSFETTLSWCCRKHVFVFEIASLKSLSEFMIKLSFSLWLLGEKIWVRHYGQSFENFSVLGVDFLCLF